MLINGLELNTLGIRLYDRVISSNNVDTTQEWLDGDIQPTNIRQQDRFKNISVSFLILSPNEEEAFLKISKLTSLLRQATIQFDDLDLLFDVSLVGSSEPTRLKNGNFIVNYTLTSDYAKGEREIYTTNANMTNSFKLTVVYYQNSNSLLATESITVRASSFNGIDDTLESIGIDTNKYQPQYFNYGVATNLNGLELTYDNLQTLGALIINYAPIVYSIDVHYYMNNGNGYYTEILNAPTSFTYNQVKNAKSIGQIIDAKSYKPDGYSAKIDFNKDLTIENLLAMSPISVFYDKIEVEKSKNVVVNYLVENDNGNFNTANVAVLNIKESSFVEGMTLNDNLLWPHRYSPLLSLNHIVFDC